MDFAGGKLFLQTGVIGRVFLNQPEKRNALSQSMWQAIPAVCEAIEADPSIRVVIVSGSGRIRICHKLQKAKLSACTMFLAARRKHSAVKRS